MSQSTKSPKGIKPKLTVPEDHPVTKDHLQKLFMALQEIPAEHRSHALAVVRTSLHLDIESVAVQYFKEIAERAEAFRVEKHRREKVIQDFAGLGKDVITQILGKDAVVKLEGVVSKADTGTATGAVEESA